MLSGNAQEESAGQGANTATPRPGSPICEPEKPVNGKAGSTSDLEKILRGGEMAEKKGAFWKKAARHVIDCLPRAEN
jgi:hypothetical protein